MVNQLQIKVSEYDKRFEILVANSRVCKHLKKDLTKIERNSYANSQYSRCVCLKLSSIPESITDGGLEKTGLNIIGRAGVVINCGNVEACHRIGKKRT